MQFHVKANIISVTEIYKTNSLTQIQVKNGNRKSIL